MARRESLVEITFDSKPLRARRARLNDAVLRAARTAVQENARALEKDLEAATAAAGLGKLARAWASTVYPRAGLSDDPVGLVFPKGKGRTRGAIAAHAEGATIRGRSGNYLAVPLPAAGARGRNRELTPGAWERRTGKRLRFVYRGAGKPALLVADEGTLGRTGRFRAATDTRLASGRGLATVPIFVLLPQVSLKQRFSVAAIRAPYAQRVKRSFELAVAVAGID